MPAPSFLHNMGVASIVAGFVLLGLAEVGKKQGKIKRAVKRAR